MKKSIEEDIKHRCIKSAIEEVVWVKVQDLKEYFSRMGNYLLGAIVLEEENARKQIIF